MNLSAELTLSWGGQDRDFAFKGKQIEGIEHDCNVGIGRVVLNILSQTDYTFKQLRQTIYWGLIGGGLSPTEAQKLVLLYVDGEPIDKKNDPSSTLKTAVACATAIHFGWDSLPPGEA